MQQPDFEAIPSGEWSAAAVAQCYPDLYADMVDLLGDANPEPLLHAAVDAHFDTIDALSYLDDVLTADDPEAASAAFEQLVTGEWDGEL